jgi:hypothetical protein
MAARPEEVIISISLRTLSSRVANPRASSLYYAASGHVCKLCEGKAIPVQAWTGPAGYGGLRLPDMKTVDTW